MIGLIDIQIGNINSIVKALEYLNIKYQIVTETSELVKCSKIIFPGVGSFSAASKKLHQSGLKDCICNLVLDKKIPFFGICLGMQLIAKSSDENGNSLGLGLIDAQIKKIPESKDIKIPHIGWNNVQHDGVGLYKNIKRNADFYFVHSYRMVLNDESIKCFYTNHGVDIVAYIQHRNIFGVQFHPEKSQADGLALIKNFSELC